MPIHEMNWRLLDSGHLTGAENMAIDEAIMRAHGRGEVPPTLRFYGWNPACVSIGYFQSMEKEIDLDAVRQGGYDYVRRPTGGRMIFHHIELTYSVTIREELLPGGVIETYRLLSEGLLAGLLLLGAPEAELSGGEKDPRRQSPGGFHTACFDSASAYELTVDGKKAAGSAQTRKDGTILQHGSILLDLDAPLLFSLMKVPDHLRQRLMDRFLAKATYLREVLGRDVSYDEARDGFARGFAQGLGLTLTPGALTPAELEESRELVRTKYGTDAWNLKK